MILFLKILGCITLVILYLWYALVAGASDLAPDGSEDDYWI